MKPDLTCPLAKFFATLLQIRMSGSALDILVDDLADFREQLWVFRVFSGVGKIKAHQVFQFQSRNKPEHLISPVGLVMNNAIDSVNCCPPMMEINVSQLGLTLIITNHFGNQDPPTRLKHTKHFI